MSWCTSTSAQITGPIYNEKDQAIDPTYVENIGWLKNYHCDADDPYRLATLAEILLGAV